VSRDNALVGWKYDNLFSTFRFPATIGPYYINQVGDVFLLLQHTVLYPDFLNHQPHYTGTQGDQEHPAEDIECIF
jgi:hypothetical protein